MELTVVTERVSVLLAVAPPVSALLESETWTVRFDVPAVVGVPLMTPPVVNVSPAGNDEPLASDQVYGGVPPLAAKVVL
jgi:hypothetical protein